MEEEFIPYEQALALKELAFDEECIALYKFKKFKYKIKDCNGIVDFYNRDGKIISYLAPTFSQAFRWFREKYNLWNMIYPRDGWNYSIQKMDETISCSGESWHKVEIKSYEEAELECLKKLIEIVNEIEK